MRTATATLRGTSDYIQSAPITEEKLNKEDSRAFEARTWLLKGHWDDSGRMFIPQNSLKQCLDSAAKEMAMQIPGRGKKTYKQAFANGIMVLEPAPLPQNKEDAKPRWMFLNVDGVSGSGKRVWRAFPWMPKGWVANVKFHILNDTITNEVFEKTLREAGLFVGLGMGRPENRGYCGRFAVDSIEFAEE